MRMKRNNWIKKGFTLDESFVGISSSCKWFESKQPLSYKFDYALPYYRPIEQISKVG